MRFDIRKPAAIAVTARTGNGHIELDIANTGPAIPVEVREHIFEKYGQAQPRSGRMNLGLGLYFCRMAIEAHGGRLTVLETEDFPTVFRFALPRR